MADIQPTLDAIDEALEGYVTWSGYSPDAMVWSAEEPKVVTEEQIAEMREKVNAAFQELGEMLQAAAARAKPAFEELGRALGDFVRAMQPVLDARAESRRRLHQAYRSRLLSRRRRNR